MGQLYKGVGVSGLLVFKSMHESEHVYGLFLFVSIADQVVGIGPHKHTFEVVLLF